MGWNSWNYFRCAINETVIQEVADAIVATGLRDAGFVYINIDDCWADRRDSRGRIVPDATKFPSGMKALGDYIHSKGLKFGIYSDAGHKTCEGYPGSWGHEEQDAAAYASWGVDYVKYDYCNMEGIEELTEEVYTRMSHALGRTGRPILFSICSWGAGDPWLWGSKVAHSWRIGIDLFAAWDERQARQEMRLPSFLQSVLSAVAKTRDLHPFAGPGSFNDLDMLVVGLDGMYPYGIVQQCPEHIPDCKPGEYISRERWGRVGGLTRTEQRTHFSLWAMLASPLILGNDPRRLSAADVALLTAAEVIAVSQDELGRQAERTWVADAESLEIWTKPLAGNRWAALLFNGGTRAADITLRFSRDLAEADRANARPSSAVTREAILLADGTKACVDKVPHCAVWAAKGECEKNRGFMRTECRRSCPGGCRPSPLGQLLSEEADAAVSTPSPSPATTTAPEATGNVTATAPPVSDKKQHATALVRDAWEEEDLGLAWAMFTARMIEPHEGRLLIFTFLDEQQEQRVRQAEEDTWALFGAGMDEDEDDVGGEVGPAGYVGAAVEEKARVEVGFRALNRRFERRQKSWSRRDRDSEEEEEEGGDAPLGSMNASSRPEDTQLRHKVTALREDLYLANAEIEALRQMVRGATEEKQKERDLLSEAQAALSSASEAGTARVGSAAAGPWLASWQAKFSLLLNLLMLAAAAALATGVRRRRVSFLNRAFTKGLTKDGSV